LSYWGNATVNRLNLHYFVHSLAVNAGGVFFAVYLLQAGVPVPGVLASIAAIVGGRFVIRPFLLGFGVRFGLRPLVVCGTVLGAAQYPLLAVVHGVGTPLFALIATAAVSDTVYWTCYHAYFASLGDAELRGHQISAREAMVAVASIMGPLAGGFALAHFDARLVFGAVAMVQLVAAVPLLGAPNVPVVSGLGGSYRAAWRGVLLFSADGWISSAHFFVWPLALFITLGRSFSVFGGALALASLAGAASGLLLGRRIDAGHGGRAAWLVCGGQATITVFCAASTGRAEWAVLANAARAMVLVVYVLTLMTSVYNQAKRAQCALRFHIATEGGWDAGCGLGCLSAAGLTYAGVGLSEAVLIALPGILAALLLLRRYYKSY